MTDQSLVEALIEYLHKVPSIDGSIGHGILDGCGWWVKFGIDIAHPLAWNVVQELGHVLKLCLTR